MPASARTASNAPVNCPARSRTTDALTRRPQLDERIVRLYSVLHDMDLNSDDVQVSPRPKHQ
jgi:hypothetical protein